MPAYPTRYRAAASWNQPATTRFFKVFLAIQAVHIMVLIVVARDTMPAALMLSGTLNVVLYGMLAWSEAVSQRWLATPILLYCITAMVRLGVVVVFLAATYVTGYRDEMRVGYFDGYDYAGRGHILLLIGDWCLLFGYFATQNFLDRLRILRPTIPSLAKAAPVMGFGLVLVTWLLRVTAGSGIDIATVGMFLRMLYLFCAPAGMLLLLLASARSRGPAAPLLKIATAVVLAGELFTSLRGYMKEPTMTVLMPLGVYFLLRLRSASPTGAVLWRRLLPLAFLLASVVLVLFPFNSQLRQRYRTYGVSAGNVWPLLRDAIHAAVPGSPEFREAHVFPTRGVWEFLRRNEFTTLAGWAVSYVDTEGTIQGRTVLNGFVAIVPRILWPDKPLINSGAEFSTMIGVTATSSTALGLAASFYWNGGYILLILGMAANGFVLATTWRLVRSYLFGNPAAVIVYMALLLESARWFESQFDGAVAFYAYNWIVFVPMILLFQAFRPGQVRDESFVAPEQ